MSGHGDTTVEKFPCPRCSVPIPLFQQRCPECSADLVAATSATTPCPFCTMQISTQATRCPHCAGDVFKHSRRGSQWESSLAIAGVTLMVFTLVIVVLLGLSGML